MASRGVPDEREAATEAAMAEAYRAGPKDSLHKKRASRGQSFAAGFRAGVRWAATRDGSATAALGEIEELASRPDTLAAEDLEAINDALKEFKRGAATRDEDTDIGADVNRELTHKETEASLRQIIGELHADLDRRDATLRRIEHGCKEAAAMAPDPWRHMFVLAAQQVESALAAAPVSLPDEPKAERPFYKCAKCGDDSDDVSLGRRCPRCGAVPDERKD